MSAVRYRYTTPKHATSGVAIKNDTNMLACGQNWGANPITCVIPTGMSTAENTRLNASNALSSRTRPVALRVNSVGTPLGFCSVVISSTFPKPVTSVHERATVDRHRLTGDKARVRPCEERHHPSDVLGLLEPAHGGIRDPHLLDILRGGTAQARLPGELAVLHRRGHVAGADAVDADRVAGQLERHRLGEPHDTELR